MILRLSLPALCLGLTLSAALAQQSQQQDWPIAADAVPRTNPAPVEKAPAFRVGEEVLLDYSYVGEASTRNGKSDLGNGMEEQLFKFDYKATVPVTDRLQVQGSLGYHRFDFGATSGGLTPQNLQSAIVGVGLGYRLDDKWSLLASFAPEIQTVDGWHGDAWIHYTGGIGATYQKNPDLSFTYGLVFFPGGAMNIPILPLLVTRWHFADKWTLLAGVPRTSLTYALTDQLDLWGALSFEGGVFKTGDHYGDATGRTDLDDRKLNYSEVRVGIGADYKVCPLLTLTGQVGSAVYREFAFQHDNQIKSDPAILGEFGVKVRF